MSDEPDADRDAAGKTAGVKNSKAAARAKGEETTRVAREIIDRETAARDAKTERLKALRLAKEREDAESAAVAPAPKKPRKRAAES